MKLGPTVLALALVILVSGCSPVASIRPLYTDADLQRPVVEPRIEGEWVSPNTDEPEESAAGKMWLRWKIIPPEKPDTPYRAYSVEFCNAKPDPKEGDEASTYDVRLVAIGDKLFFDAEFRKHTQGQTDFRAGDVLGLVPAHIVGRIWVQQDFLRIALLRSNWMEENWPAGIYRISSSNYGDDDTVITGSTRELRDFLVSNADNQKALAYVAYLCRPGSDCAARAAEDALARAPEDDDVLEATAKVFFAQGNYARAVLLREQRVKLKPEDLSLHEDLSEALLFNRDFPGARGEFVAMQKLALGDPPVAVDSLTNYSGSFYSRACEDMVWSYFLEGDYGEGVKAARSYNPDPYHYSVNPLLLGYYSLQRLGRRTEAEMLLKEEAAKFKGSSEELILLLDAEGRVSDRFPRSGQKTDASLRFSFFAGLHDIAASQPDRAREHLEYVASENSDTTLGLAAKIELERLGRKPKSKGTDPPAELRNSLPCSAKTSSLPMPSVRERAARETKLVADGRSVRAPARPWPLCQRVFRITSLLKTRHHRILTGCRFCGGVG